MHTPTATQREPDEVRVSARPQRPVGEETHVALIEGRFYVIHHDETDTRMVAELQGGEFWPCGVEVGCNVTEFRVIREINTAD